MTSDLLTPTSSRTSRTFIFQLAALRSSPSPWGKGNLTITDMHRRLFLLCLFSIALLLGLVKSIDTSSSSSSPVSVGAATQCEICRDTGKCSTAYEGAPGKYCRDASSSLSETPTACCCAAVDQCFMIRSTFCSCRAVPKGLSQDIVIYLIASALFIVVCAVISFFTIRFIIRRRCQQQSRGVVYVQPVVYTQNPHLPDQQNYPQQAYASNYVPIYGPTSHATERY